MIEPRSVRKADGARVLEQLRSCLQDDLSAVAYIELLHDVPYMNLNRALTHAQFVGDQFVRASFPEHPQDLDLTGRKPSDQRTQIGRDWGALRNRARPGVQR